MRRGYVLPVMPPRGSNCLFHAGVPDDYIDRVVAAMRLADRHTYQILTKRSARMRDYLTGRGITDQHMWWGSVSKIGGTACPASSTCAPFRPPSGFSRLNRCSRTWACST